MQDSLKTEHARPTTVIKPLDPSNVVTGRWSGSRGQLRVVIGLISSDVLLALLMWQAAFVLQAILGRGPLSAVALVSIVPNVVAWIGLRAALGLYPGYGLNQVEELRRQTFALLATLTIVAVFAVASHLADSLSRVFLFAWALGLLMVAPLARHCVKAMMRSSWWGKPTIVMGTPQAGARMVDVLRQEWQLGFRPIGFFDVSMDLAGGAPGGRSRRGNLDGAVTMARKYGADTAVFTMEDTEAEHLVRLVNEASTSFRYVMVMPNLGGITNSAVTARDFMGNLAVEIKHTLLFPWARRTKQALDLVLTLGGGLLMCPLLLAIVVLIKLDSPGPAVYGHRRVGAGGEHFRCWKFRTMYTNAEQLLDECLQGDPRLRAEWEQTFKLRDDPRVTRVGRFLRKTSLDELPQLWNVIRGEMSLVGPRPYLPRESKEIGVTQSEILRVPPGVTGPWQVAGRNQTTFEERVRMDADYVRDWSVWLDLVLLARTVQTVVLRRGAS